MYPCSDAELVQQVEAAEVKIETVEIKKVYIHMYKKSAMQRQNHLVLQGGRKVSRQRGEWLRVCTNVPN